LRGAIRTAATQAACSRRRPSLQSVSAALLGPHHRFLGHYTIGVQPVQGLSELLDISCPTREPVPPCGKGCGFCQLETDDFALGQEEADAPYGCHVLIYWYNGSVPV